MNQNFKTIYKILKMLEDNMDNENFDVNLISHQHLGITEMRWNLIIQMLIENYYIAGLKEIRTFGSKYPEFTDTGIRITLQGLHYLEENSMMSKVRKALKGVKDIVPGL